MAHIKKLSVSMSKAGLPFPVPTKIIRFVRKGCTNRPFFHIVVADTRTDQHDPSIEQLGTHDPFPNEHNEKLTSLNFERIRYWLTHGAIATNPVLELLGLAGFYPIHPRSYMTAWRNREKAKEALEAAKETKEEKS
ncbi:small ribosomal subunit protein bS16m [Diabrotica undecimpunctata]|uniref:small ribosomal subunit protein bS16m n=1 Tax=Diabrotica undecimpunctata TaxID=50387 RepID=UPI003B63FDD9